MAAITSAAIVTAGSIYASNKASKQAKEQNKLAQQGIAAADPYAAYRPAAAERLNALMADPSSIKDTASYKARMQAVQRQLASQGYTGSGNALVEAAEAAGTAYQQEFNNLSMLSGAGVAPGGGYDNALMANQNANDTQLSGYAGIINNLGNLASTIGNNRTGGNTPPTTFNQPAVTHEATH